MENTLDKIRQGIEVITSNKINPVHFYSYHGYVFLNYFVFDTSNVIGDMLVYDDQNREVWIYKGFDLLLIAKEPDSEIDVLKRSRWFEMRKASDRKLLKLLNKHVSKLEKESFFENGNEYDISPLLEHAEDREYMLNNRPHHLFKLDWEFNMRTDANQEHVEII